MQERMQIPRSKPARRSRKRYDEMHPELYTYVQKSFTINSKVLHVGFGLSTVSVCYFTNPKFPSAASVLLHLVGGIHSQWLTKIVSYGNSCRLFVCVVVGYSDQ